MNTPYTTFVLVRSDSGITNITQLKNATFANSKPGSNDAIALDLVAGNMGWNISSIHRVYWDPLAANTQPWSQGKLPQQSSTCGTSSSFVVGSSNPSTLITWLGPERSSWPTGTSWPPTPRTSKLSSRP